LAEPIVAVELERFVLAVSRPEERVGAEYDGREESLLRLG